MESASKPIALASIVAYSVQSSAAMTKTILSPTEGLDLLSKLLSEHIRVHALSMWGTGSLVLLSGFVDSLTDLNGIVISAASPPSEGSGYISVRTFGRTCEFSYCDKRELPSEAQEHVSKILEH